MSKHSPGPWQKSDKIWDKGFISDANGNSIIEYAGCGSHSIDWSNQNDYNLVLIAPEMLKFLKELEDQPGILHEDNIKIKSLIKKAGG